MTLFIIGNGFDLNHGYKTSYEDFGAYLSDKGEEYTLTDSGDTLETFFESESTSSMWSDFEESLGHIELNAISDRLIGIGDEDDRDTCDNELTNFYRLEEFQDADLHGLIGKALCDFIVERTQVKCAPKQPFSQVFSVPCRFITFNFSLTLENVYGIDENNICHIHGVAKKVSPYMDHHDVDSGYPPVPIVYGHSTSCGYDEDGYDDDLSDIASFICAEMTKNYKIEEFKDFLDKIGKVDEVQIIGHSLGEVDEPYFKCLAKNLPCHTRCVFWAYEKDATAPQEIERFNRLFTGHDLEVKPYK